jgi:hypothetical protein
MLHQTDLFSVPAESSWNASNPVVEVGLQRESCLDHNSAKDYAVHDESDPAFRRELR